MKVTDCIKSAKGKTQVSFEILPPLKGGHISSIFNMLDPLMEFKPPFIDVTYHREEYIYKQRPSGYYEKTSIRKRPGTVGICTAIMNKYGIDAVPHLICGGFTIEETENALIDLNFLGINNVLALRGDARKFENRFVPQDGGHPYAIDLVKQIGAMNKGEYLDQNIVNGQKTDFCVGVAGYPEKHFEAPNPEVDLQFLKAKIDAGADYIVTQMFWDNENYLKYIENCRSVGIKVPIIPGLKPITKLRQLQSIPRIFHVNFPNDLVKEISKCKTDADAREVGIEWTVQQSLELKKAGAPVLHYYTMGDVSTFTAIAKKVF